MINDALFSSNSDEWFTPQQFFDTVNQEFNFTLDVAATTSNTKCKKFFTIVDNGLEQDWSNEVVWCNPPYSDIKLWVEKAYNESLKGTKIVLLIPVRTDTRYFHSFIYGKAELRFIKGRLKFECEDKTKITRFGGTVNFPIAIGRATGISILGI